MDREHSTFGLSRAKVARLMQMGMEKDQAEHEPSSTEDAAELLHDQLMRPFTLGGDASTSSKMPHRLTSVESTGTVGDVLRSRNTPASVLKKLKEHGRTLFSEGRTEQQRDVGLTIYYCAIASAMIFHDVRITRLSYRELRQALVALADKAWMPSEFRALFCEACRTCESHDSDAAGTCDR